MNAASHSLIRPALRSVRVRRSAATATTSACASTAIRSGARYASTRPGAWSISMPEQRPGIPQEDRDMHGWRLLRDRLRFAVLFPVARGVWSVAKFVNRIGDWFCDLATVRWP